MRTDFRNLTYDEEKLLRDIIRFSAFDTITLRKASQEEEDYYFDVITGKRNTDPTTAESFFNDYTEQFEHIDKIIKRFKILLVYMNDGSAYKARIHRGDEDVDELYRYIGTGYYPYILYDFAEMVVNFDFFMEELNKNNVFYSNQYVHEFASLINIWNVVG